MYGDAVTGASTPVFSFDPILKLWGNGKLFPIGLVINANIRIIFDIESLQNCTTSASGTASGGASTEFECICEWIDTTDYYAIERSKLNENQAKHGDEHVYFKLPFFYPENCGKTDLTASTDEHAIALDNSNG